MFSVASSVLALGAGFGLSRMYHRQQIKKANKKNLKNAAIVKEEISLCINGMEEHINQVLDNTPIETDPFPHLIIENLFPDHMYKHACEIWPPFEEFVGAKNAQRFILPITYGCLEDTNLSLGQKVFWRLFGEVIVNRYLKPKLAEKFAPYLYQKLGLQNDWQSFNPHRDTCNLRQDCLIVDKDPPSSAPHVDQLNMLAQIMIYFPSDTKHEDLGTVFFHGDPSNTPNHLYDVTNVPNITFAKKALFRPNTLVAFMQTPTAWHSFERPDNLDPQYLRRIFLSPLFLSPEFMQRHYSAIYARTIVDEYFFDHRLLKKRHWSNIWGNDA